MDFVSALGLVQSSFGLALQIGEVAKTLNDVADKYKNAKLAIKSLTQNLDILELAWTQIGEWYQKQSEDGLHDISLTKRVQGFLETGMLVIEALQHDLQSYNIDDIGFSQRTRFIWNETSLQAHRSRIRDQALSMSLFLQVVNLPTPQARAKLLHDSDSLFKKSNESAYSIDSIVPSQMSASTGRRDSYVSDQDADIVQPHRLSFERGLFMSRVYMRNCKNVMAKEIFKAKLGSKRKVGVTTADQTAKNWEAIRDQIDADSLLARSCEESFNDADTIKSHTNSESRHRFSGESVCDVIEGDSLLARGSEGSFNDNKNVPLIPDTPFRRSARAQGTIRSHTDSESRQRCFEELITPSASGAIFENELIQSCEQGDSLQTRWLAVRGVDPHAPFKNGPYSGFTATHVATINGHIDVVKILLSCGASIEEETASECRRPLHLAALTGQVSMARFLIREGAQIDAKAEYGMQPIHDASWSGSVEIFDALAEAGAAVDCLDSFGHQPLHWAAVPLNQSNQSNDMGPKSENLARKLELAKHLLCRGAAVDIINYQGCSPLYLAIYYRNPRLSRLLIGSGSYTLMILDGFLANLKVPWLPSSQTPSYSLDILHIGSDFKIRRLAHGLELSVDDDGYLTEAAMESVRAEICQISNGRADLSLPSSPSSASP